MDLKQHLIRQMVWSRATFGPGARTEGVLDHISKEIEEVRGSGGSPDEWVDLVILTLDGLTRQIWNESKTSVGGLYSAEYAASAACHMIVEKQSRNELRDWPDWRTAPKDKAIEHVKTSAGCPNCGYRHPPDGMCV